MVTPEGSNSSFVCVFAGIGPLHTLAAPVLLHLLAPWLFPLALIDAGALLLCSLVSQSAPAGTEYHSLGGGNSRHLLLIVLEASGLRSRYRHG